MVTKKTVKNNTPAEILSLIKKSKKILLVCHEGPDHDSIISCLLARGSFEKLGKTADIFCINEIKDEHKFLDPRGEIKKANFDNFNFSKYDLFFALDVPELKRLGISDSSRVIIPVVNIDHHEGSGFGNYNFIHKKSGSTTILIYNLLKEWRLKLSKEEINLVLTGIVADCDVFRYWDSPEIFRTVAELIELGGDYESVLFQLLRRNNFKTLKWWGVALDTLKIDKKNKFAYISIPFGTYRKFEKYTGQTRTLADTFIRTIEGTNFGIIMVEHEKNNLKISIRSRDIGFSVYPLLLMLRGGGYQTGGGAVVKDMPFKKAVAKVLKIARQFASGK